MSSRNLSYVLTKTNRPFEIKKAILNAIHNNAADYTNPPITNIGYKGILKTSKEIYNWFDTSKNIESDFSTSAMLMERAGTGGALFRNLFRDFLKESYEILKIGTLKQAYEEFIDIASLWTEVSELFIQVGKTKDRKYIDKASGILKQLSTREKNIMEVLKEIKPND